MNKLGKMNYCLFVVGLKSTGSFVEAYNYSLESFRLDEADEIYGFCKWCDDNDKTFGYLNYEERFKEYLTEKKGGAK